MKCVWTPSEIYSNQLHSVFIKSDENKVRGTLILIDNEESLNLFQNHFYNKKVKIGMGVLDIYNEFDKYGRCKYIPLRLCSSQEEAMLFFETFCNNLSEV